MTGRMIDVAIAGGGLAGGLIALALHRARPELRVALVESGPAFGGNHRWSWFASDLSAEGTALLDPFRTSAWNGYSVAFPDHARQLDTAYRSLASVDFDAALRRELPGDAVLSDRTVAALDAQGIDLASGERIEARTVIDCRGIDAAPQLTGGWQIFMGRHLRTAQAHGLDRPIIMDADVAQHGAYRFVYTLPLSSEELFVEDTYYASTPALDRNALSGRIDRYCARAGWNGEPLGFETGVLPVITGGDFAAFQAAHRTHGVAVAGTRGGFIHPLTSYSLPFAVQTALTVAREADLSGVQLSALLEAGARRHWARTRFYRQLGRMLFAAGAAEDRWRVFARFYRLPSALIERFYAARSTRLDRTRVLCGRPPVPVIGAMAALTGQGRSLARDAA